MEACCGYRKTPQGNLRMYMNIRSAGFYAVEPPWRDRTFQHTFAQLFWCGSGAFRFEEGPAPGLLQQGEVCLLFPGDMHKISAADRGELYWMSFDGPRVRDIIDTFDLKHGIFTAGDVPKHLFNQIIEEVNTLTPEGEYKAGATGYRILSLAIAGRESIQSCSALYRRFMGLLACNFANPNYGIADYTEALNCHRSTLMRLMRKYHNCTPVEYLRSLRLKKACELLSGTSCSIKEIALRCGFEDPNYFAKVFRRRYNKNPSDFRRE